MGEVSEIIDSLNLPKQLLDKGEKVIKAVLGPSISEISETFADNFRLRRFKNQINILTKAQKYIEKKGIEPKKIDLKVLAPLIELSSLEEDIELQEKWAKLITNIVIVDGQTLLKQNCINIISKISNREAKLIDYLYDLFLTKRLERYNRDLERYLKNVKRYGDKWPHKNKEIDEYPLKWFDFSIKSVSNDLKFNNSDIELMISNLITIGVIKYVPEVEVSSAEKSDTDPEDTSLDVDIEIYDSYKIRITELGYNFMIMCKFEN